ncbi:hypothetical protein K488DRAFT_83919 [Vararia minispora EC-137]|uniref:Uncharacterized protein n=1 Tax=Vararia minispora EC-137 TaxID=1314806 RepID=A0ACB8QS57_9AGAM|nr:hypothetical protein K488DRAFT_83919 [Vararia minispora EC-137]
MALDVSFCPELSKTNAASSEYGPPTFIFVLNFRGLTLSISALILHAFIVVVYLVLIVIWANGWERHTVQLSESSRLQTYSNALFHAFNLLLSAAALVATQRLGVRVSFGDLPQPLTALGDRAEAWNGLGACVLTVYNNLRFRVTRSLLLIAAVYFAALSILGFSSSFLFSVPSFNINNSLVSDIAIGTPDIRSFIPTAALAPSGPQAADLPSDFQNISFDWFSSSAGLSILAGAAAPEFPGLSGSRVFDTIASNMSTVNATAVVGYTDFHVKCGQLGHTSPVNWTSSFMTSSSGFIFDLPPPKAGVQSEAMMVPVIIQATYQLSDDQAPATLNDTWLPRYLVQRDTQTGNLLSWNTSAAMWQPSNALVRVPQQQFAPGQGRNLVLYVVRGDDLSDPTSSQAILDASGSPGPLSTLTISNEFTPIVNATFHVQMIGCSLSTTSGTTNVDASTNRLVDMSDLPAGKSDSLWGDWRPDPTSSNQLEDTWAWMFMPNSSMTVWYESSDASSSTGEGVLTNEWSCPATLSIFTLTNTSASGLTNSSGCHVPTVIEQYLSNALFGASAVNPSGPPSSPQTTSQTAPTLQTLESALANATAMTMWSAARASTLTTYMQGEHIFTFLNTSLFARAEPQAGTTLVTVLETVGRMEINPWVLFLGTGAAVVLLAVTVSLVARGGHAPPVDSVSLLHIAALDTSAVAPRFANVDMNSTLARRRAGKFRVTIVNDAIVAVDEGI